MCDNRRWLRRAVGVIPPIVRSCMRPAIRRLVQYNIRKIRPSPWRTVSVLVGPLGVIFFWLGANVEIGQGLILTFWTTLKTFSY
jgi:hypothetical protein